MRAYRKGVALVAVQARVHFGQDDVVFEARDVHVDVVVVCSYTHGSAKTQLVARNTNDAVQRVMV